jgi:hypothetical protein
MNENMSENKLFSISKQILPRLFMRPRYVRPTWPNGRLFAFTIIDDTDQATIDNIKPIYDYLNKLGLKTTKTVWVLPTNNPEHIPNQGMSLQDTSYKDFVLDLKSKGFEIALHGARGGSSKRDEILTAIETYKDIIGDYPKIHINHSSNKDNLYWGIHKLSFSPIKLLYKLKQFESDFEGHSEYSEYYWGDIAREHITYVVKFSFFETNILKVYPRIPYHDNKRPYVNYWFHSSDGGRVDSFKELLSSGNLDHLEKEGGLCIVYTHFGKGFCNNGEIISSIKERLDDVASRKGWFAPAGDILDHLRKHNDTTIGHRDKIYLDLRWALEKIFYGAS